MAHQPKHPAPAGVFDTPDRLATGTKYAAWIAYLLDLLFAKDAASAGAAPDASPAALTPETKAALKDVVDAHCH